ncbi:hypothetical protein C7M84_024450, partial [Penaeus vannamei]
MDPRQRYGSYDEVCERSTGRVRLCNWVRFVSYALHFTPQVNMVASRVRGSVVFEVVREVVPGERLVVFFLPDMSGEDTLLLPALTFLRSSLYRRTIDSIMAEAPLDLSRSLLTSPPSPPPSTHTPSVPLKRKAEDHPPHPAPPPRPPRPPPLRVPSAKLSSDVHVLPPAAEAPGGPGRQGARALRLTSFPAQPQAPHLLVVVGGAAGVSSPHHPGPGHATLVVGGRPPGGACGRVAAQAPRADDAAVLGVRQGVRPAVAAEAAHPDAHGREAPRVRRVRQGLLDQLVPQHPPQDPQRREAPPVRRVRQAVHGLVQPLLPQDDPRQGEAAQVLAVHALLPDARRPPLAHVRAQRPVAPQVLRLRQGLQQAHQPAQPRASACG